jgi:branched-chain amino acid transport system substrate-binding protein
MLRRTVNEFLAIGLCAFASLASAQNEIAVGYQLPLTGDNSQYGTLFKNSADMALEQFNASGKLPGTKVVIKYEDSKSDAKEGVNIARKFSDDAHILGVIGDFNSTVSMAAGQIYAEQHVPQLSQSASHPDFLKISDWQFRNITTMAVESPFIAKWMAQNNLKHYAVIGIQNDWGQSSVKNFSEEAATLGNEVVDTEFFNPGNRDFRSILTKVARSKPDAIVLFMFYEEAASFLQQRAQMNVQTVVYGGSPLYEPKLLQLAGPAANGLMMPSTFVAQSADASVKAYVEGYRQRYGSEPSMFAAQAYDATNIMLDAIVAAGPEPTRAKVRDALAATHDYPGVTGVTTFDPITREVTKQLNRMIVSDGAYKVIQ